MAEAWVVEISHMARAVALVGGHGATACQVLRVAEVGWEELELAGAVARVTTERKGHCCKSLASTSETYCDALCAC